MQAKNWPDTIPLKTVTAGPAFFLEDGAMAITEVQVRASRSLTYNGQPMISTSRTVRVPAGNEVAFTLPVCDLEGAKDANGQIIVLGDGEVTHTYTVQIRFFAPSSSSPIETRQRGPFVLLSSDPDVTDLDTLITTEPPGTGRGVWVGDMFGEQLAQAGQATERALEAALAAQEAAESITADVNAIATSALVADQRAMDAADRAEASADASANAWNYAAAAAADAAIAREIADKDWTGPAGPAATVDETMLRSLIMRMVMEMSEGVDFTLPNVRSRCCTESVFKPGGGQYAHPDGECDHD
jgi:hypothetical protein